MTKTPLALIATVVAVGLSACGGTDTAATSAGTSSATSATAAARATPPAGMPQMQDVTGTAASKAKAAALAKYDGTVEHVTKGRDGGYVVHVITGSGEKRVAVSDAFAVTGLEQLPAGAPPSGTAPAPGSTASAQ